MTVLRIRNVLPATIFMLYSLCIFCAGAFAADVVIRIDSSAEPCISHGAEKLGEALESKKLSVQIGSRSITGDEFTVFLGTPESDWTGDIENALPSVSEKAESYSLAVLKDKNIIIATGSDAVGAMYSAYELAEQVRDIADGKDIPAGLENTTGEPFLEIRAVNPFLHVDALTDPGSWYFKDEFWETYLDLLSESRYNLIDFHAMYDVNTTWFPNAFIFLVKSEKYPDVGLPAEESERNLDMFKKIIKMAKDRGIRVSLMSYQAGWKFSKTEETKPYEPSEEELSDYTRDVVSRIIRECPDLWMLGFRIGESGMGESFYEGSYIAGIEESGRDINLFTRTWGVKHENIYALSDKFSGRFYIEIKYNGEQLGLPYQAITDTSNTVPSYSWESYGDYPRDYKIIWQIRANGTHRIYRWGDPSFARRVSLTSKFIDASGFSIEPMTSYYPMTDYIFKENGNITYRWDHDRNWFWYELFGRTGYNPDLDDSVWIDKFKQRYGDEAGPVMYRAMVSGSKLIPLIYSWRCRGYDHRHMAPEYEYGGNMYEFFKSPGNDLYNSSNDKLSYQDTLDPNAISTIYEYVDDSLKVDYKNFPGSEMSPFEVADVLDDYANQTENALSEADKLDIRDRQYFDSMKAEFTAVIFFARYYSNKIRASTYFKFFETTNSWDDLMNSQKYITEAVNNWKLLSDHGDRVFRPLHELLRMKTRSFAFSNVLIKVESDASIIEKAKQEYLNKIRNATKYEIGHHPATRVPYNQPLEIEAVAFPLKGGEKLFLNLKHESEKEIHRIELTRTAVAESGFSVTIPSKTFGSGKAAYFLELFNGDEKAARFPPKGAVKMIFKSEDTEPVITIESVDVTEDNKYRITAEIIDDSDIDRAALFYKSMHTETDWQTIPMVHAGNGGFFAELPVDRRGWIYFIRAADANDNSTMYPDFRERASYLTIKPFDPAEK